MCSRAAVGMLFVLSSQVFCCGRQDAPPAPKKTAPAGLAFEAVEWRTEGSGAGAIDASEFGRMIAAAFRAVPPGPRSVTRSHISGLLDLTGGEGRLALKVRLEKEGVPIPISLAVAATASLEDAESTRRMVRRGLEDLASAARAAIRVVDGDKRVWISSLEAAEPDLQALAAQLLGAFRVQEGIASLAALLSDPRETVVEAAAEALAQIGDERAVPLLIRSIPRGDLRGEVRVIEAIGRIGGREAEAYLEMTALGHEVPEVRILSQNLIDRLRKRGKHRDRP